MNSPITIYRHNFLLRLMDRYDEKNRFNYCLFVFYLSTILFSVKFWFRRSILPEAHSKQEKLIQHNIIFEFLQTLEEMLDQFSP